MKFVVISDTHGQHKGVILPKADVLIHAGDVSSRGYDHEIINFLNWFKEQNYEYKIFIAGNHDFFFEKESEKIIRKIIPKNIIYLNDSGVNIKGINIWGSPISPWFFDWAFNRQRGEEISRHWELIPQNTDILITHGPAYGILDKTIGKEKAGCEDLLLKIQKVKPKFHLFGHIHEAYGIHKTKQTTFINASVLDQRYQMKNKSVEFELNRK